MTREDKDSIVEMLAKIPITETKGSLLSAIGRLLRVIDISESSIMIPTLLKDKCEFDAYEMLTLAKILKASILGHNDLVEFYMSESSSQLNILAHQHHKQLQQHQQLQLSTIHNHSTSHHQQLRQQSATPSLRSSISDSTSSSSPSSPSTPSPHSDSINGIISNQLLPYQPSTSNGEPDATLRLLLHIEQLKVFIPQVTGIFESIIELYKNSVDTI